MKPKFGMQIFAFFELLIGSVTLFSVTFSLIQGRSTKPPAVLIFVLTTAVISTILGFGIFRQSPLARKILIYFSSIIILSKMLIFAKIISLSGALETTIPAPYKNAISIFYHSLLIFYFRRKSVRKEFGEI